MIIHHDFRYEHTLRLNFDIPVGIGSYGFETKDSLKEFYNQYNDNDITFEIYQKCNNLEEQINDILRNCLKSCDNGHFELDWRDDFEIEIHGIDQTKFNDNIIQEIDSKLKSLFEGGKMQEVVIKVSELKINVYGDKNQYCTKHEDGQIKKGCVFYCDGNAEFDCQCSIFGQLEWDIENYEYQRHENCLAAEV